MTLTGCDYKSMELDCLLLQIFWETLSECCFGAYVLVRRLMEWRRFHFWYQPRDALNSGSSLNSFAFRRSINPLTAIAMQNEVRRSRNDQKVKNLTRLEVVLTFVNTQCCHMIIRYFCESHIQQLILTLQSADWFISCDLVSVVLRY